jgi:hypothetical protein
VIARLAGVALDARFAARTRNLLERIVPHGRLHARFINTLSRLEYVGVRKILKSRRSEHLELDGLQHILDEAVHAMRLKKAAVALAGEGDGVATFAPRSMKFEAMEQAEFRRLRDAITDVIENEIGCKADDLLQEVA